MTSSRLRWGQWGALFGVCFPVMALTIRWAQAGTAGAWLALTTDPLLWIIVTAPVFLGVFAALGGHQHDGLRQLTEELEARVRVRTADLANAVDRQRLITDNVADGLLTIDLEGSLQGSPSAQAIRWFGQPESGVLLEAWLQAEDPHFGSALELGLEQIRDDILPVELTLAQLPGHFKRDGRHYELEARKISGTQELLIVIRDTTDRLELARERAAGEERHAAVAHMLRDPRGFQVFRKDCMHLLEESRSEDPGVCKQALHTLKGNAAVYGFKRFSDLCHHIEDELAECGTQQLTLDQGHRLERAFEESLEQVAAFLPDDADLVRVTREELLGLAESAGVADHVRAELHRWAYEPLEPILERLAAHGRSVAARLGKQVTFVVDASGARVNLDAYGEFVSQLCHIVRNAVDHGVESSDERLEAEKPPGAVIELKARETSAGTRLSFRDDGRGIDWERVARKAKQLGMPAVTPEQRLTALLSDGFSTKDGVTHISGRGVGLGAVWSSAETSGVVASLESKRGAGTCIEFLMPRAPRSGSMKVAV